MLLHHVIFADDTLYVAGILKECKVAAFDIASQMYSVPIIDICIR